MCVCVYIYIWLCHVACGIKIPDQGSNPGHSSESLKAPSPNHWTSREFPPLYMFSLSMHPSVDI